jgi:hypothetical protein
MSEFDAWLQRARNNTRSSNVDLATAGSPVAPLPLSPSLSSGCDAHPSDSIRQQYEYALDDMARYAISPTTITNINATMNLSMFRSGATSPGGECKSPGSAVTCLTDMSLAERHLRRLALIHPIPVGHDDLRRRLWRTLLAHEGNFVQFQCLYASLKARGPSTMHLQIQYDLAILTQSDRFLSNTTGSQKQTTSLMEALARVLNAFVHRMQGKQALLMLHVLSLSIDQNI